MIYFAGSKIRAAVALITFDEFHRHSAKVIQHAVFADPVAKDMMPALKFQANNLVGNRQDCVSLGNYELSLLNLPLGLTKSDLSLKLTVL